MYIELYLIINFLMNLIMLKIASALCSCRIPAARAVLGAGSGAVYAAAAAVLPVLLTLPAKLLSCLLMAFSLPFDGLRQYVSRVGAVFLSAFLTGGLTVCLAFITGAFDDGIASSLPLGTALAAAATAAFLPRAARALVRRTAAGTGELIVTHGGREYRVGAIVDTGSSLMEPLSGTPVSVVPIYELRVNCVIPVPVSTVAGNTLIYAFRPERMELVYFERPRGRRITLDSLAAVPTPAVTQKTAIIPPAALPA